MEYWLLWVQALEKNVLLNLVNRRPDIKKIYLHAKDPHDPKYKLLINKSDQTGLKHVKDPKTITEYSSDIKKVYPSIAEYSNKTKTIDCIC